MQVVSDATYIAARTPSTGGLCVCVSDALSAADAAPSARTYPRQVNHHAINRRGEPRLNGLADEEKPLSMVAVWLDGANFRPSPVRSSKSVA